MPPQDQAIVTTYTKLLASWNAQDAAGMATLFAEGGAQVGFDGSEAQGQRTIHAQLAPIFRDHPTKRFVHVIREVQHVTDDVAMLRAIAGMVPRDSLELDESENVVQTLVLRKDGAGWRIVLFQNTPARLDGRPDAVAAMSKELRVAAEHQLGRGSAKPNTRATSTLRPPSAP